MTLEVSTTPSGPPSVSRAADQPHRNRRLRVQRRDQRPHVGRVLGAGAEPDHRLPRPVRRHVDDGHEQAFLRETLTHSYQEVRVARGERTAL
jgi:hypothetical protein